MIEFEHPLSKFKLESESQTPEPDRSVSPQTMLEPVFREMEDRDVEQILALQNRSFGSKRTLEDWNWKSVDNPYLQKASLVGVLGDRIISSYSLIGFKLSVLGSPMLIAHSTDTVIDADFRGKRYFHFLFNSAVMCCERIGVQAAVGFPNEQAIRANLNQGHLYPFVTLNAYSQRLCLPQRSKSQSLKYALSGLIFRIWIESRLMARKERLQKAVGSSVKIEKSLSLPESYEELWNNERKRGIVSIWKDTEYMRWRYEKNPRGQVDYFCAFKNGTLCGLAILVRKGNLSYITELMVRELDVDLGKLLVNQILQYSMNRGIEVVKFFGHDRGFFSLAFSEFMRQPSEDMVFVGQLYNDLLRRLCKQPLNLCLTTGDSDLTW